MVKQKTISLGNITIGASGTITKDVSMNLPSGSKTVGITIVSATYYGWFSFGVCSSSNETTLKIGIHNTYTSALTDNFSVIIGYI